MKDIAMIVGVVTMYTAVFGMAAWLIYKGVDWLCPGSDWPMEAD